MKFTKIVFFVLILMLSSCETSDIEIKEDVISKEKVLNKIKSDINNNLSYSNVINKYDYSSVFLDNYIKLKKKSTFNKQSSYEYDKKNLISYYQSVGFSNSELENIFKKVEKLKFDSMEDMLKTMAPNEYERAILNFYIDIFYDVNISVEQFEQFTTIFEYYVDNSNFSTKGKRDMLTIFNILVYVRAEIENNSIFSYIELKHNESFFDRQIILKNDDIVYAGNILVYMGGGAILGNGPGAAVGILFGLWEDYKYGCFN